MTEPILHLEEVANYIADLLKSVRDIKRELKIAGREDDLSAGEPPEDVGGVLGGGTSAEFLTPIVRVTSIVDAELLMGRRQRPVDGVAGWIDDTDFVNDLEVALPPNVVFPGLDDLLSVRFTGNYQRFTAGTTITLPRYGLLGSGGSTSRQFLVTGINDDTLTCRKLTFVSTVTVVDTVDIFVAKPFELQQTPWDGNTIDGVTYVYTGSQFRVATQASTVENHLITPSYIASFTQIIAKRPLGGTNIMSAVFQDEGAGRGWSKVQ